MKKFYLALGSLALPFISLAQSTTIGGEQTPYIADFYEWKTYDVNNDETAFGTKVWEIKHSGATAEITSSSSNANDWIISPLLNFEANKTYVVKYSPYKSYGDQNNPQFKIYLGTGTAVADMNNHLLTVTDITLLRTASLDAPRTFKLNVVEAGEQATASEEPDTYTINAGNATIGIQAFTKYDACGISNFTIYADSSTVTGIDITTAEEEGNVYYTIQGTRVYNPDKGLYIVRNGGKTSKVIIR